MKELSISINEEKARVLIGINKENIKKWNDLITQAMDENKRLLALIGEDTSAPIQPTQQLLVGYSWRTELRKYWQVYSNSWIDAQGMAKYISERDSITDTETIKQLTNKFSVALAGLSKEGKVERQNKEGLTSEYLYREVKK